MKQFVAFLLIVALVLCCAACAPVSENACTFFYLRTADTVRYGEADGLIAPVTREIASEDLDYLLQLYLDGPVEENYVSPIPRGTRLLSVRWDEDTLVLELSREFSALDNIHLTLAGACLAATCHAMTGTESIRVHSDRQIYDFNLNNYTFLDTSVGE